MTISINGSSGVPNPSISSQGAIEDPSHLVLSDAIGSYKPSSISQLTSNSADVAASTISLVQLPLLEHLKSLLISEDIDDVQRKSCLLILLHLSQNKDILNHISDWTSISQVLADDREDITSNISDRLFLMFMDILLENQEKHNTSMTSDQLSVIQQLRSKGNILAESCIKNIISTKV